MAVIGGWMLVWLAGAAMPSAAVEWTRVQPRLVSQVQPVDVNMARALLAGVCAEAPRMGQHGRAGCAVAAGRGFEGGDWFEVEGVVMGHFRSAGSDDAVVSGWTRSKKQGSGPMAGGTLLLSRVNGHWNTVWYRKSLLSYHCDKGLMPGRRELLVCESEDGEGGNIRHLIYSLDLLRPEVLSEDAVLAQATSVEQICFDGQQQTIRSVRWERAEQGPLSLSIEYAETRRSRRFRVSTECDPGRADEELPMQVRRLRFVLADDGFHPR